MATNNFGNFTFSPTSLLATEERAELCHYVTMFDRADVATMRNRAIGQERIGNLVAATGLR
ncbi:hypothetical protein GM524_13035, partial [Streptococcus pneumoniae]|uniref:hypothetical protein n=1 Tax=Streptococcus pneumoniae TaxID=1313 RepID=UPI0012D77821